MSRPRRTSLALVAAALAVALLAGCSGSRDRLEEAETTTTVDDATAQSNAEAAAENRPDAPAPGTVDELTSSDAAALRAAVPRTLFIDVRPQDEYIAGHMVGAQNIPIGDDTVWDQRIAALDLDRPTVVYCNSGTLSAEAAQRLVDLGFLEVYDLGAMADWTPGDLPVDRQAS